MKRYPVWLWVLVLVSLGMCSCLSKDGSNPLDGNVTGLFIPQVSRPVGGEQWFPGMTQEIRWKPATEVLDAFVTLQLVRDGDPASPRMIADHVPNSGRFVWTVPDLPSQSCRIRVIGRDGYSESPGSFWINPQPVLHQMAIGGEGREPAALREQIIFTSNRTGNDDLWMFDRLTGALTRLTFDPGFDEDADWLKPNGRIFAFTSEQSGQRNVWIMATAGPAQFTSRRVTTAGGERPAWQPSTASSSFPSLAYQVKGSPPFSHIVAVTFALPIETLIAQMPDPIPTQASLPVRLTSADYGFPSVTDIRTIAWGFTNATNVVLYDTPLQLWRIDLLANLSPVSVSPFVVSLPFGSSPKHPAISLDGKRVAFSAQGDLWVMPIRGGMTVQVTYDEAEDDFPDWATDTTLVFQRRQTANHPWEIWTVEVP